MAPLTTLFRPDRRILKNIVARIKKAGIKYDRKGLRDLRKSGLISEKTQLSPPTSNVNKFRGHPAGDEERRAKIPFYRPWDSLDEKEQDELDLEMAVFAAMVDRMDQNIGRVLNYLDENGSG